MRPCTHSMSLRYGTFSIKQAISDMNDIHQFQDIRRIFIRIGERTDRLLDRQTNALTI